VLGSTSSGGASYGNAAPAAPVKLPLNASEVPDIFAIDDFGHLKLAERGDQTYQFSVTGILFRGNGSDFVGLDPDVIAKNNETLDRIAAFLNQYPQYKVRIEGHANPVQTTAAGRAHEEARYLKPITNARARAIADLLVDRGVERSRLTPVGLGGTKPIARISDKANWWKNRRVEFILY
jgi:outer membrane protein OmpA-like peptidoglycan-associated protein